MASPDPDPSTVTSDPSAVTDPQTVTPASERPPLAAKALSEEYVGVRYRDTSLLIWSQHRLQPLPPHTYLSRSQHTWYTSHGNQPVLVPQRDPQRDQRESRICSVQ